jgi:hypothetical protein
MQKHLDVVVSLRRCGAAVGWAAVSLVVGGSVSSALVAAVADFF